MARKPKAPISVPDKDSTPDEKPVDFLVTHALLESLYRIFSTMVMLEINPGVPELKAGNAAAGVVSGLIEMNAKDTHGSVALSLSMPALRAISASMLGEEFVSLNKEASDLVGELTNMLVGGAKQILSEQGLEFDMHIPHMLMGEGHEIVHPVSGKTIILPIATNDTEFFLELNFA